MSAAGCEVCQTECGALRYCDDECRGYAEGRAYGERETIARVVAFIRSQSGWDDGPSRYVTHPCPFRLAAAIERGEWKGEP